MLPGGTAGGAVAPTAAPCTALPGAGGGGAGSPGRPWAGRAMPWGSSRKGALCCHTSPTAERAQGGPGVGEGPAWVPGRSPFQNLDMGTLRLSTEPVQPLGGAGTSPRASISSAGLCDFPMSPQLPRRESTSPCAQRRSRGREEDGSWHLHPQRGCPHRAALGKYWLRRIDQQNHTPKGFPCWTSSRSKPDTLLPGPLASALIPNTHRRSPRVNGGPPSPGVRLVYYSLLDSLWVKLGRHDTLSQTLRPRRRGLSPPRSGVLHKHSSAVTRSNAPSRLQLGFLPGVPRRTVLAGR